ncbi:MAG: 50S ribosomal protein L24 [Pirellulales bacterium]|nr:50S ribosomal protein L24 [Pirellulales bacterium]
MRIRTNDIVLVTAGDDRGARGKVLKVLEDQGKVVVEGVNRVYRHMRRTQKNPQGGRLSKEMPIDISNVTLLDPSSDRPTRVGVRLLADGTKERYAKRSGASLGTITKPRKADAKK